LQIHPYGGPFHRFSAFLADALVIALIGTVIDLSLGLPGGISQEALEAQAGVPSYLKLGVHLIYWPLFESSALQGTPGKLLLRLRVTNLQKQRITFAQALLRNLAKILSLIPLGFGFLMIGITIKNQCLHDKIAKTLVMKRINTAVSTPVNITH